METLRALRSFFARPRSRIPDDILIDRVLRLAYDQYGDEGVNLIKRIQQQQREQQTRKEATLDRTTEEEVDDDDDDDDVEASLYDRMEQLLKSNPLEAKRELQRFMEQHDYHENLSEENQVQLACSMDFPPVVDLKSMFLEGRDYLTLAKQRIVAQARQASPEERKYFSQRLQQEQGLVDYQINRIRDAQKGSVGFTLSSNQPRSVGTMSGTKVQPKWSMAIGTSADLVYPGVAEIMVLAGKEKQELEHPASAFVNAVYQPVPDSQINLTANLSNDQSHQVSNSLFMIVIKSAAISISCRFLCKVCPRYCPYILQSIQLPIQFDVLVEVAAGHKHDPQFKVISSHQRYWYGFGRSIDGSQRKDNAMECQIGSRQRKGNCAQNVGKGFCWIAGQCPRVVVQTQEPQEIMAR